MVTGLVWMVLLAGCGHLHRTKCQDGWWDDPTDSSPYGGLPTITETACEEDRINLRCHGDDVIEILSANYGRLNSATCSGASSEEMENTHCSLRGAKKILETRCNNRTECNFEVSSSIFNDPCSGTRKYLKTTHRCLKFMFQCPGYLIGIGREHPARVDVLPRAASWTKDPLQNPRHVYFAPSERTVNEYTTWDDFVNGIYDSTYSLPSRMRRGNFVVYDRNLYYVKADSRNIVRFSLITLSRTKESIIPGSGSSRNALGGDISLAVDENGIWVTYTKSTNGVITISKINQDSLALEDSWTTSRRVAQSLHTFVICGVLYSVGSRSGKVDYSYNTNLKSNAENNDLDISFNAPGRRLPGNRRSLRHNATFLAYNPRDQLIYSWDEISGSAVYYTLTFDGLDTEVNYVTSTTSTTTSATTRATREPLTVARTNKPTLTKSAVSTFVPPVVPDLNSCPATNRGSFTWPKTEAGKTARMPCGDGFGGYATYQCVRQPSMREAAWFVTGPDVTECITWATGIRHKYRTSELDMATAFDELLSGLKQYGVNDKSLQFSAELISELLEDKTTPSKAATKSMLLVLSEIDDELMKRDKAWDDLSAEKRSEVAASLMAATEKIGFFYADLVSAEPSDVRDNDPLIVRGRELIMQVEIRSKTPAQYASRDVTSFPNGGNCRENSRVCSGGLIQIPDAEIMKQRVVTDPSTIVFALYNKLGDYLAESDAEWALDSKVISATLTQPNSKTELAQPATIVLQHKQQIRKPRRCVFWDSEHSRSGNGEWSDSGCRLKTSNLTHTTCQCDHLSSFAVQTNEREYEAQAFYDPMLDVVTKIGISIAMVCLLFCVLTLSCFKNLRIDRNIVHQHFCICLLVVEMLFLFGINQTQYAIYCSVVAGLLHYFFIATFSWVALESIQLFAELGESGNRKSKFRWWKYLAAYGTPLIIVGISVGVGYESYGTARVCWIEVESGLIWTLVGPIALLIMLNLVFLSMTVCKMYKNSMAFNDTGRINSVKAAVRGASVLLCLLGITWAFGILWLTEEYPILAYLFCVFNAFQGIFIFIYYCLLPKKVRHEYTKCLGRLPCCKKLGRDYVSNSLSFSKQYSGRYPNGNNAGSQQASLNRPSHLRRMWNETIVTPKTSQSSPPVSDPASNREVNRNAPCPHRPGGQHAAPCPPEPRQRQEDDVFLPPPDIEKDSRSENARLLHNPPGDIEYDRLQYYRCPEHYNARPYTPQGNYHPPAAQHRLIQPPASISPPPHLIHPNYGVQYHPRSPPEMHFEPGHPHGNRQDAAHPYYWELDPPLAQHHHVHQSSIEENTSSGKRDSGISMQHLPPNSMIHRFANEVQRCGLQRSRDSPISPTGSHSSSRQTPPVRIQEEALHHSQLHHHQPRYPNHQTRGTLSEDEGQGSSFEDRENTKNLSHSKSEKAPARGTTHTPRGVSPPIKLEKPIPMVPDQRAAGSVQSDSDDPIVTDCSGSSAASSFGRHYRSWANQENMV